MQSSPSNAHEAVPDRAPVTSSGLLSDKVVIVSGAASGMGRVVSVQAAHEGAAVLGVDIDEAGLDRLRDETSIETLTEDLTDAEAGKAVVSHCLTNLGQPSGLVNSAGVFRTRELLDIQPGEFDRVFNVNVHALFFLQQAVAAEMTFGGSIVNFASTAARVARPRSSHYAASKAAVVSLSRSAAVAWAGRGIRVNSVCPGVIATPMLDAILEEQSALAGITPAELEAQWCEQNPMGRLGRTDEVADLVTFLLSDRSSYITAESIGINGGADDI